MRARRFRGLQKDQKSLMLWEVLPNAEIDLHYDRLPASKTRSTTDHDDTVYFYSSCGMQLGFSR